MEPSAYLIVVNFEGDTDLLTSLHRYIMDSKDVVAYWNYIPLVYIVKSYESLFMLRNKLCEILRKKPFLITQIQPSQADGLLPKEAWEWFHHSHGQLSVTQMLERHFGQSA